jgi:hypothetical protein
MALYSKWPRRAAIMCLVACGVAGCAETPTPTPAPSYATSSIPVDQFVGRWGLASYHNDADRARTEKEARGQCNKPYVIAKGPHGGLMMNLADQAQLDELAVKGGDGGRTFIGPGGEPAGGPNDREVISPSPNSFTTTWVDADNAARYGTMVYVRCGTKS